MRVYSEQVLDCMRTDGTVILNILPKSDFQKLHIKGSKSLPLGKDPDAFYEELVEKYGQKKMFIVYGLRFGLLDSYIAARVLEDRGLKVLNYTGGLEEWHRLGLPVGGTQILPEGEMSQETA